MTQRSFKKYKLLSFIFKDLLHKFCRIYTKSAYDKNLIEKIYEKKLEYTGNTKFNNLEVKVDKDIIDTFKNKKCLLLASTHNGEESFFIKYAYKYIDKFDYVIIAPRHINRIGKIEQLLKKYNYPVAVFSINKNFKKFIIIDVYGLMDSFYAISSKIFVGGSLVNVGGHNIYEALRLKKFIAVGPFMNNFIDIYELALFYGLIHTINNIDDFLNYLNNNERKEELFNYFFSELENKNRKTLNHILSTIKNEIK
jgi:3-deoxy-D-manno-octulosonic-acid transferase